MRLLSGLARTITIRKRENDFDTSRYNYTRGGYEVYADIQPTGYSDARNQEKLRMFGEMPERALVCYCAGTAGLAAGQGVCVDVAGDEPCDYRITGVEAWPNHTKAYLAYIPENRRG